MRVNQEIAMRIALLAPRCRKTTLPAVLAGLGMTGLALGWSAIAGAQDAADQEGFAASVARSAMSENATSATSVSYLSNQQTNSSRDPIAQGLPAGVDQADPAMAEPLENADMDEQAPSETFRHAQLSSAMIHERNIGDGVEKVTTTVMPDAPRASSVTLWDEIVPPKPAPVPVGAAQPTPVGVAGPASH
jgi:hypothetical protein